MYACPAPYCRSAHALPRCTWAVDRLQKSGTAAPLPKPKKVKIHKDLSDLVQYCMAVKFKVRHAEAAAVEAGPWARAGGN